MSPPQSFATADGTLLNVVLQGAGPDVIFQHGLGGSEAQVAEIFPVDVAFCRTTIDCRGHGGSELGPVDRLSIATFADDIAAWIEVEARPPVVVAGISMGAAIALRLAVVRPDLVRALLLARPAWVTGKAPATMAPNGEVGRLMQSLPSDEARTAFLASPTGRRLATEAPDNLASLAGFFSREPAAATAALLVAISADGPGVSDADVSALSLPTLVLGSEQDVIHPIAYARALAAAIPGAQFAPLTPKGESRERYVADFQQAVRTFLEALPTP